MKDHVSLREIIYAFLITMMIVFFLYGVWALSAPPKALADSPSTQICEFFNTNGVSEDTVFGLGSALMNEGHLTPSDAADLVKTSVLLECPWHFKALIHAAENYQGSSANVTLR